MHMKVERIKVRLTLAEEMLGTGSSDVHEKYIAKNAPDAKSVAEEVEATSVEEVVVKGMTIFARDEDENPQLWDYQIKGFFKDACSMLSRVPDSESSKLTAFKKVIDGLIFVYPRAITLNLPEGAEPGDITRPGQGCYFSVGNCQRPLRITGPLGERVALANSETVPIGTTMELEIEFQELKAPKEPKKDKGVVDKDGKYKKTPKSAKSVNIRACIEEWLDYGARRGLGQWRNSGKGRFSWETLEEQ